MRAFDNMTPKAMTRSSEAAAMLAEAAWVARCARRMAEVAHNVELEQARAVAEFSSNDGHLRQFSPEVAAERLVRSRCTLRIVRQTPR